jgi:hypothetical protein
MKTFYYNNKIDWSSVIINFILWPFRFIFLILSKIFIILKKFITDIINAFYKKIVEVFVLALFIIIIFTLSKYNF